MKPLSTRVFELDATYDEIINNIDTHKELKTMKALVIEKNVVFFIYRGCERNAVAITCSG